MWFLMDSQPDVLNNCLEVEFNISLADFFAINIVYQYY